METHLQNKFLPCASKKACDFCAKRRDNMTNQRMDLVHSIYMLLWSFWNAWGKSVIKVFLCNCLKRPCSHTAASTSESNDSIYCYVSSSRSEAQVIFLYMKIIIFSGFSYILVMFSATVYQEVTILFSLTHCMETMLYSHVLCNIPVLHIS